MLIQSSCCPPRERLLCYRSGSPIPVYYYVIDHVVGGVEGMAGLKDHDGRGQEGTLAG